MAFFHRPIRWCEIAAMPRHCAVALQGPNQRAKVLFITPPALDRGSVNHLLVLPMVCRLVGQIPPVFARIGGRRNRLQDFDSRLFGKQIERQVLVIPRVVCNHFLERLEFVLTPGRVH